MDLHGARGALGRPAVGRPGRPRGGVSARRLDRSGRCCARVLVGIIFGCSVAIGRLRGLIERTAALLTLAAFAVSAVALAMRPQLIGMAIFAVVLLLVVGPARAPAAAVARPGHRRGLGEHARQLLPRAGGPGARLARGRPRPRSGRPPRPGGGRRISVAAACVNPFGPAVWAYAVGLSTNPLVTQRITEWQPTSLRTIPGILFFGRAAAVVVLIARRGTATAWPTLAWLGVFFVIGAFAIRGVAWWPLAAVAAIAGIARGRPAADLRARVDPPLIRRANLAIAIVLVLVGVALLPVWRPDRARPGRPGRGRRERATGHHRRTAHEGASPGDRLFAPQPWGSWFEFSLPALPIGIDSRIELFPVSVWDDYELVVSGADGWQDRLRTWGVTLAVVAGDDQAAFEDRLRAAGWQPVYHDDDGTILTAPDRPGA